ncbi:sugar-binding protein [Subtercola boreus]|uniref:Sugar-binding protein n=1 Tax=Subtercola boreus TaxID=120213 RepID=A0A3E0VTB0_9MICO|nr:sugar ABC transporter substrate-binding protein [Subtercola boreus]RFA13126.1 sugar-binding protein [Subtercola boreus]
MKKRVLGAAAIFAAAALTLAGCSGSTGSGSGGDAGGSITYWASNQGTSLQNDKDVLQPLLDKFTAQTGVKVNLEVIGWNDLQTRIQTAVTSGVGPDVVNIGNTWATSFQATGAFLPFDDSAMGAIGGADKFASTALSTGGAAGQTATSVPLYGYAYGLYYNKAMFAAAGLTPPTTWEEMVADGKKLTDPSKGVWGTSIEAGSYTENNHFAFITSAQNGGSFFDGSGTPTFTESQNVDGIKRYLDLMQTDKIADPADAQYSTGTESIANFAKGTAAMIFNQNNAEANLTADGMDASQYGVVPIPAPSAGKPAASFIAGINLSVFKNTKNKDAALKFVNFITSADTQSALGKPFSSIPVLKDATPTFTTDPAIATTFSNIYNNLSEPLPTVPLEASFETEVGNAMNTLFATVATGGSVSTSDIESALSTAQEKVAASN